jgi:hypothetical protein
MLTAETVRSDLMDRLLHADGGALHYAVSLGRSESYERLGSAGWEQAGSSVPPEITAGAACFRALAKQYPALTVTYPSRVISTVVRKDGMARIRLRQNFAEVSVPEDFSRVHGGEAFCSFLRENWSEQCAELTALLAKRLRRHELRTQRLFGAAHMERVSFTLDCEYAQSDIWNIGLERCGLYPLQWENEVFGMARLLRDDLTAALRTDCGDGLCIRIAREENACRLTLEYGTQDGTLC